MKGPLPSEYPDTLASSVHDAIEQCLTPKQREAVCLFFFDGLSQSEIARRLGVSQQVIHRRLHGSPRRGSLIGGALPRLRAALAPLWESHADEAHDRGATEACDSAGTS